MISTCATRPETRPADLAWVHVGGLLIATGTCPASP